MHIERRALPALIIAAIVLVIAVAANAGALIWGLVEMIK
jgi:hypothetical protein